MVRIPKVLFLVLVLAFFFRVYKLNTFPLGFHVDEVKVGWEALSILKTGRDDQGHLLPLYYNSFGDYRPTGIFYSAIPFIILFGKTNEAVRFSSVLAGSLTVIPLYFITLALTKNKKTALISSILLAIVPWHLATSRATSEVVISCFLILSSMALLQKKPRMSFILLGLSFLFYHSARIMGPTLMLIWIIYSWKKITYYQRTLIGFILTSLIALVLVLSPTGMARYDQVRLASPSLRNIVIQYSSYFDPNFLIGDIAKPFRYVTANVGIISIPIFILFLLGVAVVIKTNKNKILILMFALGPIPASLTLEDSPNLHRAFFMLPFLIILAAIGFNWIWENHKTLGKIMIVCIAWSFLSFAINYMDINNNFAFQYRDPQSKRLAIYIASVKNNYNKIYVTNDPDSPYSWYGFFNSIDPSKMNIGLEKQINGKWQFENIVWDNTRCPAANAFDEAKKNILLTKIMVVDNGACFTDFEKLHPEANIIKEFDYNGKVNYRIWEYIPTRK